VSTILIRVSGRDRPGITAALMDRLAAGGAEIFDVEQVVLRGRLTLGVLVDVPEGATTVKDVLFLGWERDLQVDFEIVEDQPEVPQPRSVVTIIGPRVGAEAFGAAASAIAGAAGNIDRIIRLSRYPVVSYELAVRGGDLDGMREALLRVSSELPVDIAVQAEGLDRRAKRLVVLDVDSTLIQDEVIDLLAEEAGVVERVRELTAAAMTGSVDFERALRDRVALLEGLDREALDRVWAKVRLTPGARTFVRTLHRLGMKVAVISGGFTEFTDRLRLDLGLDHAFANQLEVVDGRLTGRLIGPIVDRARKAEILRDVADAEGIPLEQTVAVGDGANDLDMLAAAGLGIAFNAKPVVRTAADTALRVPYLDAILFLLGIRRDEVDPSEPVPVDGLPPV
jgi:phosphoserine phosphatase